MKKIAIYLFIFLLLLPNVAYAEGETETSAEAETPAETETDIDTPTDEEVPPDEVLPEEVPEATNNTIVITDANGNQYTISAGIITEGTAGEETEATATLEETAETDAIIAALQAQGVNMDADTLTAALAALGLDAPGLTATVQAAQIRPMLTTPFADYTVTEGLLLVLCVLLVIRMILKLFAM